MLSKWFRDESGQALSEYGLLIAVVGVAVVAAMVAFREKLAGVFAAAGDKLEKGK